MISDEELNYMESYKLLLTNPPKLEEDKRRLDRIWVERKRLIRELRRLRAILGQIAYLSAIAVDPEGPEHHMR